MRESLYAHLDTFADVTHVEDCERVARMWQERKSGVHRLEEYRILQPDGTVRWIQDRSFPIRDSTGRAYRVAGIAQDVTEQKHAAEQLRSQVTALQSKIRAMYGLIDTTIHVVRRIAAELRPSILDDLGLAAALEWQAQQFQDRTGILCQYAGVEERLELDQEQSTAIFRIFQEALTNVLRHAQATRVAVRLAEEGGTDSNLSAG
jgi:hypothetical protein